MLNRAIQRSMRPKVNDRPIITRAYCIEFPGQHKKKQKLNPVALRSRKEIENTEVTKWTDRELWRSVEGHRTDFTWVSSSIQPWGNYPIPGRNHWKEQNHPHCEASTNSDFYQPKWKNLWPTNTRQSTWKNTAWTMGEISYEDKKTKQNKRLERIKLFANKCVPSQAQVKNNLRNLNAGD